MGILSFFGFGRSKEGYNKDSNESKASTSTQKSPTKEIDVKAIANNFVRKHSFESGQHNLLEQLISHPDLKDFHQQQDAINEYLSKVSSVSVEDLAFLGKTSYNIFLPENKIKHSGAWDVDNDTLTKVIQKFGLNNVIALFTDETFPGRRPLQVLKEIDKSLFGNNSYYSGLIWYFSQGEGQKYLNDDFSRYFIHSMTSELVTNDNLLEKCSPEFRSHLEPLLTIYAEEDFAKKMELLKTLPLIDQTEYLSFQLDGECEDGTESIPEEWYIFFHHWDLFLLYINSVDEIHDGDLYFFLMINDILPEKHKEDNRYDEDTIKEAEESMAKLNSAQLPEFEIGKDFLEYVLENDNREKFIDYCVVKNKSVPITFWQAIPDGEMCEALGYYYYDSDEYVPHILTGFLKSGRSLPFPTLSGFIGANAYAAIKLYYQSLNKVSS